MMATISISKATNQSQQRSEESAEKKMDGAKIISKGLLWRNKVEHPAAFTKSSETLEPEGVCVSLNLIGEHLVQPSGTNKKTSTTHNHSIAERKQVNVKPASKPSVRTNFQGLMRITPLLVERSDTTLKDQVKKTTEWRVTSTNGPNLKLVKTKPIGANPTSTFSCLITQDSMLHCFSFKMKMLDKRKTSLPYNLSLHTKMQLFNGGLPNVGNSCYVNAGLQCLFTAEAFCEELSHLLDSSFQTNVNSFLRCFVNLSKLRKTSKGVIGKDSLLLGLIALAADINPEFTIGKQSDAHEFLCHCLTQIEEFGRCLGWKEDSEPKCPVRSNFKFMMRNIIKCSSCGYQQKNKVEEFKHISLPLEHNSVDQCLHNTVNEPTFVESKCKFCGGISARSSLTFHTLPRFMILQLNRFKMTEDYTVIKQQISMDIQSQLQINCLSQSDATRIEDMKAEARHTERNNLVRERQKNIMNEGGSATTYQLISVLSHVGSSTLCGHYVSDCSSPYVNPLEWMTYDDDLVTLTTEAKVLKRRSCSAYVLLYEKVHTIKENTTCFTF